MRTVRKQICQVDILYQNPFYVLLVCTKSTRAFGIARLGNSESQLMISGTLHELQTADFGAPLHSLVSVCQ